MAHPFYTSSPAFSFVALKDMQQQAPFVPKDSSPDAKLKSLLAKKKKSAGVRKYEKYEVFDDDTLD